MIHKKISIQPKEEVMEELWNKKDMIHRKQIVKWKK